MEMKWAVRTILKSPKRAFASIKFLKAFHPDAEELYNAITDLGKVIEQLQGSSARILTHVSGGGRGRGRGDGGGSGNDALDACNGSWLSTGPGLLYYFLTCPQPWLRSSPLLSLLCLSPPLQSHSSTLLLPGLPLRPSQGVQLGHCASPQLALICASPEKAIEKLKHARFVMECKFDGERMQVGGREVWRGCRWVGGRCGEGAGG